METNTVLLYSSLGIIAGIGNPCSGKTPTTPSSISKPNVLIVVVDDFGWGQFALNKDQYGLSELNQRIVERVAYSPQLSQDLAERATPTLAKLAKKGIRFTDAYVSANVSSPSRAGLITASYQQRYGFYNLADGNGSIDQSVVLMPKLMQAHGYVTGSFGKIHYLPQGDSVSFRKGLTPNDMGLGDGKTGRKWWPVDKCGGETRGCL